MIKKDVFRCRQDNFQPEVNTWNCNCPAYHHIFVAINTVDGLFFVGYQFSWLAWRVRSTNSRAHEVAIFCMNNEGKYYGHEF